MPLVARDGDQIITSYTLSPSAWDALRRGNRGGSRLQACCCESPVICKTSQLGTPFFAHKASPALKCEFRGESALHLQSKMIVARAGQNAGWSTEIEFASIGGGWRADVLLQGPERRIAVEIQTSPITSQELQRRHSRYTASGIQCVWLLSRPGEHIANEDMPIFQLVGTADEPHVMLMPGAYADDPISLGNFISRYLAGGVRWTPWFGDTLPLDLWVAPERCRTGLHQSVQIVHAVLRVSATWPGSEDTVLSWPHLQFGSRANELLTFLEKLPMESDGISRPRRVSSKAGLYIGQGCDACGKSSWGGQRGKVRPWRTLEVKASCSWGRMRASSEGFAYQWWYGLRAAAGSGVGPGKI